METCTVLTLTGRSGRQTRAVSLLEQGSGGGNGHDDKQSACAAKVPELQGEVLQETMMLAMAQEIPRDYALN